MSYSMQNVHSDGLIHQRGPAIVAPGYLVLRPALIYVRMMLNDRHMLAGHLFYGLGGLMITFASGVQAGYYYLDIDMGSTRPMMHIT